MKYVRSVAVAACLLIAVLVHPARAQTPVLTNADIVHLVAMRVSDETVIAVIQETAATQFDLSPQAAIELAVDGVPVAVIGAMRRSQIPSTTPTSGSASSAPPAGQTLAGAAAEAAAAAQARSLTASPASEPLPAPATAASAVSEAAVPAAPAPGEADWRARVTPLHLTLRDNRAKEGPLLNRISSLTTELSHLAPSNARRRGIETEKLRVIAELTALRELLRADTAAIQAVEEDGRRAGVPPAWLQ